MEYYIKGNEKFRQGNFDDSVAYYTLGVGALSTTSEENQELLTKLLLNRAQANKQIKAYDNVVKDCGDVLKLISTHRVEYSLSTIVKAHARRAHALENLGIFDSALVDVRGALDCIESNVHFPLYAKLQKDLIAQFYRISDCLSKDKKVTRFEGVPESLVTSNQLLRLFFIDTPPRLIKIREIYTLRTSITNEFGLWNRSILTASTTSVGLIHKAIFMGSR